VLTPVPRIATAWLPLRTKAIDHRFGVLQLMKALEICRGATVGY